MVRSLFKSVLALSLIASSYSGFSQQQAGVVHLKKSPMSDGYIKDCDQQKTEDKKMYRPSTFVEVYSKSDKVFAVDGGKVINVSRIGSTSMVIVNYNEGFFEAYGGLKTVSVNKNENITQGMEIGIADKDEYTDAYKVQFSIWHAEKDKRSVNLPCSDVVARLSKAD